MLKESHYQRSPDHNKAGFTMMEVVVVLMIIAILIATLMNGLQQARMSAWRVKSRDTARQLVSAWTLYLTEEREFPAVGSLRDGDIQKGFCTTRANLELLNRDNVYLELSEKEREDGLLDRWRNYFYFNLDFDYDGMVINPAPESKYQRHVKSSDMKMVRSSVIAWSTGFDPDNKKGWIIQW